VRFSEIGKSLTCGAACQWLCRHAACPDWPSRAASLVSVRAAKRRPRQHAPFRARPIRSHAEVTGPSALRRRLCVWCRPLHRSRANITLLEPCSIIGKSCTASPCCRRPAQASVPPLPSTSKRAATAPTSSSELGSCRWLAASALSSRQVEPRCSTKSAAFGHASCAAILVDQGHPRPQRHRRATSFSPTVSR
jgi:hypothetical protein